MPITRMLPGTIERIRAMLGQGGRTLDSSALTMLLRDLHPSDIAFVLDELTLPEALAIFNLLDIPTAADVLDEVSSDTNRYLVHNTPHDRIVSLLDILPMDDAAELVAELSSEAGEDPNRLLAGLPSADAREVQELLSYKEGTAGRLMTDKFLSVTAQMTAAQTIDKVRREGRTVETPYVIYVVNGGGRLSGVCSLRDVLTAGQEQPLSSLMNPEPITVAPDTDQQEVARLISQYDLLAIPVVHKEGRLLGIVTVDDVIDVLVEEFNEDYLRLVGSDADEMDRRTPMQVAKLRLPWLMGTMLIELGAGVVIQHYDDVLKKIILLASFMPVISAISGNVGLQAAAIIVRGLDTGHVSIENIWKPVIKELTTSVIMAVVCGLVLGLVGVIWSHHIPFGIVIGGAMTCSMLTAGFMGTVIPMLSKKFGFDPAATAGPFETAFQDVIGFAVFLWLASLLLHWLQ